MTSFDSDKRPILDGVDPGSDVEASCERSVRPTRRRLIADWKCHVFILYLLLVAVTGWSLFSFHLVRQNLADRPRSTGVGVTAVEEQRIDVDLDTLQPRHDDERNGVPQTMTGRAIAADVSGSAPKFANRIENAQTGSSVSSRRRRSADGDEDRMSADVDNDEYELDRSAVDDDQTSEDGAEISPTYARSRRQRDTGRRSRSGTGSSSTGKERADLQQVSRAVHFHAAPDVPKQFKTQPMVSFNSTPAGDTVYRFWRKADWVSNESEQYFQLLPDGHVVILEDGLYLIYAQMVYHDLTGRWSFGVYVDTSERFKCLASEQLRDVSGLHPTSHGVYQQCATSATTYLRRYQHVYLRCMYGSRTILTQQEFTFWGIVKLS